MILMLTCGLVLSCIGHMAEKRKLRYAVELENYNRKLHEKIEAFTAFLMRMSQNIQGVISDE